MARRIFKPFRFPACSPGTESTRQQKQASCGRKKQTGRLQQCLPRARRVENTEIARPQDACLFQPGVFNPWLFLNMRGAYFLLRIAALMGNIGRNVGLEDKICAAHICLEDSKFSLSGVLNNATGVSATILSSRGKRSNVKARLLQF